MSSVVEDVTEDVAEIVAEHRETIERVADGDDEPAAWAREWLREADDGD